MPTSYIPSSEHALAWLLSLWINACSQGARAVLPSPTSCKTREWPSSLGFSNPFLLWGFPETKNTPWFICPCKDAMFFSLAFLCFAHTIPTALKCELPQGSDSHGIVPTGAIQTPSPTTVPLAMTHWIRGQGAQTTGKVTNLPQQTMRKWALPTSFGSFLFAWSLLLAFPDFLAMQ